MFHWRASVGNGGPLVVETAITGRAPSRGSSPYEGFNLGGHVGDDPAVVEANRAHLSDALGVPRDRLLFLNQVHGNEVVTVEGPWRGVAPEADGMVCRTTDLALAVLVADCVPVLLHDVAAGVVGAVHAGRPGLMAGAVPRAVEAMRSVGATAVSAIVGPSVCGRCYEVPEHMARAAAEVAPASAARSWTGTPAIDVAGGIVEQLARLDVDITWVAGCTREEPSLYSYRRDRVTGRFAGVVVLRTSGSK